MAVTFPFPPAVEAWRPLFVQYAGDLPINFLLAWVQDESAGNPCSFTSMGESGIIQLDPGNMVQAGTSANALRSGCVGTQQPRGGFTYPFGLTDDELREQVVSGVRYVNILRDQAHKLLDVAGISWPESSGDFWSVVKLLHALPILGNFLGTASAQLGHSPATWDEFASTVPDNVNGFDARHWINEAHGVGIYGEGGGSSSAPSFWLTAAIGLAIGAWLAWRQGRHALLR